MYKLKVMAHILLEEPATSADTLDILPRTHEEKVKPELLNERYKITGHLLGKGTYGEVFLAIDHGNDMQKVAIKMCDMSRHCISVYHAQLKREVDIGIQIPAHPNVCKTLDSFVIGYIFYIVMELVEGKSFDVYMRENKWNPKNLPFFLAILYQMALAIAHLHANRIIHRDIKPINFILSQNPDGTTRVILVDFGLSNQFDIVEQESVGTPIFMSPQVAGWIGIDEKCDIWAFGVLILLILSRKEVPLYLEESKDSDQAIRIICNLKVNPFPIKLTENKNQMIVFLSTIAKRCLEIDKSRRPSAAEIVANLSKFMV
jgi:serine/threonine protein kinase